MTSEEQQRKTELEKQINEEFSLLQQKLGDLKNDVQSEIDESKKQEKSEKIHEIELKLREIEVGKERIERMTSLQEQDLLSLKTRLESLKNVILNFRGEITGLQNEILTTPSTYELLKGSETYNRILNIISSNPKQFENLKNDKGQKLETPEQVLEYIFKKIRTSIVQFMENKLGNSEKNKQIINNTIAPAFERNLMELLRNQGDESNKSILQGMVNAIDYLSIHKEILETPEKSEILSNPIKFQEYLNNEKFSSNGFDPYSSFSNEENKQLFKIDDSQNLKFGLSPQEKQEVLSKIGNIEIVNDPKTTTLITKMLNRPESFFGNSTKLQKTANFLLNGLNAINGITKVFGIDIMGKFTEHSENSSFGYKILNFIFKLIGFTGGIEGIVKKRRLDRLNLSGTKINNIKLIYEKFKRNGLNNDAVTISNQTSCEQVLQEFELTDLNKNSPSTRGDFLCLSIADNIDLNLISPSIVQELMGNNYISEYVGKDGKKKTRVMIEKFGNREKKQLVYNHIKKMKDHLKGNYSKLTDFYENINSVDDITICMTTALYANKNDVIEGVKAKVFLPEYYGSTIESASTGGSSGGENKGNGDQEKGSGGGENLDSNESSDRQIVNEQWVYNKAKEFGVTDNRQIAYILSTIKGESGFRNQKEIGGENKSYGRIDPKTGKAYYGRGFIQLTHKGNYQIYTNIIRNSGKNFNDNNGNTIKGSEIDLVQNPDLILQSNDLAIFIAIDWMKSGGPTRQSNKRLDYYINKNKQDYFNARVIINGMSSNPKGYANTAQDYLSKLGSNQTQLT